MKKFSARGGGALGARNLFRSAVGRAWAVAGGRGGGALPLARSLAANRRLPSLSWASAASAGTEAAGGLAARTEEATLMQAMVAKTVSLDVGFIVRSYLFEVDLLK